MINSNWTIKQTKIGAHAPKAFPFFWHSFQQQFLLFKQYWFVCWRTAWFHPSVIFTVFVYFLKYSRLKDVAVGPPTWIINSKFSLTSISLLAICASWGMTTQVLCLYFLSWLETFFFFGGLSPLISHHWFFHYSLL